MSYSFLRESKLYIVYSGTKYRIYTSSAISFGQTFTDDSYSVKTLHDQSKMFEGVSITKAQPASFNFDVPLTIEKDESIVVDLLGDVTDGQLKSFDVYVQTNSSTFKLENAIITSANIDFGKENQFTVQLEGQGTKLSRISSTSVTAGAFVVGYKYKITATSVDGGASTDFTSIGAANNNVGTEFTASGAGSGTGTASYVIPGSAHSEQSTRTPIMVYPVITAVGLDMNNIISATLQLQNNVEWTPFTNLHNSLSVTSSSNAMFPSGYTLGTRIISGEIRQYQIDNNNSGDNVRQFDDFSTNTNLTIKAIKMGEAVDADPFFQIQLNPVKYTARMDPADVYTQSYDYRSLDNTAVGTSITEYS